MVVTLMTAVLFVLAACGDAEGNRGEFDSESGGRGPEPSNGRSGPGGPGGPGEPDRNPPATPDPRMEGDRIHNIWPQVWSQHAPGVKSWEYKVNCNNVDNLTSHTIPCFLSDLTAVNVEAPDGSVTQLDYDFNTNEYSGEVTRRWVKYGPSEGSLPEQGDYTFRYWRGEELAFEQVAEYLADPIAFPTGVEWRRDGDDLVVDWTPPPEADSSMNYKAIIWQVDDTPPAFASKQFDWDADSGVMQDVPLLEGGSYSLNVAIYFSDGYAYSDYVIFDWPGE